jgi:hypothetical protein
MTPIEIEQLTPLSDLTLSQVIEGVENRKQVPMIAYVIDPSTGSRIKCLKPVSRMHVIDWAIIFVQLINLISHCYVSESGMCFKNSLHLILASLLKLGRKTQLVL